MPPPPLPMTTPALGSATDSPASPQATRAATRHPNVDASKSVIVRVALQPPRTWSQKRSRPMPNGDTTPMPVMTTRGHHVTYAMSTFDRVLVWSGGALFALALAACAYAYLFVWSAPATSSVAWTT